MAKIQSWFGRTGNNVLQVGNALVDAFCNKSVFSCPAHALFDTFSIPFGYSPQNSGMFFHIEPTAYGALDEFTSLRLRLIQQFLLPRINLPLISADLKDLIDNGAVVAHARGGDIFGHSPPSSYIQHPLDFYLHLAKIYPKVILTYEDKTNPIVSALSNNSNFHLTSNEPSVDFSIFTQAKFVALGGIGTFVPSACLLNTKLLTVYFSTLAPIDPYLPSNMIFKKICIDLKGYIPENEWMASNAQKDFMLRYKLPNL